VRSAAAAIAWEFRRKHRWGLIALGGYLLVLAAYRLLILGPGRTVDFEDAQSFAFAVVGPITASVLYLLAVFSFGLSGDLAARQSIYPARMFSLPVSNAALAGWPMLYGSVTMAILWFATRPLALWPSGFPIPVIWPALLAASLLAWTQALVWMPYALPGLRVIVTVLWLATIDAVVMLALHFKAGEPVMLALLAPHVPLAYLTARFAVGRARRGDVPDWRAILDRLGRVADVLPHRRERFPSPRSAQVWFEWRRHGRSLPALVGILLPFELALLFVARDTPAIVFGTMLLASITPPLMAVFVAATLGESNPQGSDSYGVTPFLATRPLTSVSLVAAKLEVTIWSTLAAWLLVLAAVPLALRLSGTAPMVIERARRLVEVMGTPRAVAIVLLVLSALMASTWKQLVQSLCIGLTGRGWLVKTSVFGTLSFLAIAVPLAQWIHGSKSLMGVLWNALPWIAAALVCFKVSAAAWIAFRLRDRRLLGDRTLLLGAACWDITVFALYGVLVWLTPGILFPSYVLALVAILEVPLVRLSAAPLSLAWNRHR